MCLSYSLLAALFLLTKSRFSFLEKLIERISYCIKLSLSLMEYEISSECFLIEWDLSQFWIVFSEKNNPDSRHMCFNFSNLCWTDGVNSTASMRSDRLGYLNFFWPFANGLQLSFVALKSHWCGCENKSFVWFGRAV